MEALAVGQCLRRSRGDNLRHGIKRRRVERLNKFHYYIELHGLRSRNESPTSVLNLKNLELTSYPVTEDTIDMETFSGIDNTSAIRSDTTKTTIFEGGKWATAEEIGRLINSNSTMPEFIVNEWKYSGRIFSVMYRNKEYFAVYQFDSSYEPLPIIADVMKAFGQYTDSWTLAAWFHFPNAWIAKDGSESLLPDRPKDVLRRHEEILQAARCRKGTYIA